LRNCNQRQLKTIAGGSAAQTGVKRNCSLRMLTFLVRRKVSYKNPSGEWFGHCNIFNVRDAILLFVFPASPKWVNSRQLILPLPIDFLIALM
jgi:hypothetical protein